MNYDIDYEPTCEDCDARMESEWNEWGNVLGWYCVECDHAVYE